MTTGAYVKRILHATAHARSRRHPLPDGVLAETRAVIVPFHKFRKYNATIWKDSPTKSRVFMPQLPK